MRGADRFIQIYNELDEHLAKIIGDYNHMAFSQKIAKDSRVNPTVSRESARLHKYGELRNAISHDRLYPSEIIAEPTEATLQQFEQILQRIIAPKRLDTFQKPIRVFSPEEPLTTTLHYMHTHNFSQVVVQQDQKLRLLTIEGIGRWLAEHATQELVDIAAARIVDTLTFDSLTSFHIMRRDATIDDARAVFVRAIEQKRPRLFAIIVTHSGKPTEKPVGLVTPWDLIDDQEA